MYKLLIISFAFLLTVACTKQRDTQFAQGQGENLLSVSNYDGKTFEITTGAPIDGKQQNVSKASQIQIKAKSLGADSFFVVSYEVNDSLGKSLLGNTPIVGKVNTKYKGLIKVEQNYVKVYKVAKADDLPLNERTYAIKMGEELAVPLIGYPITSRITVDRAKNEYGEKTSTNIEKNEVSIGNATHFRIDMSRGQIFEAAMKTDVLPSSYLNGEWYFAETITAAPEERATNLGFVIGQDESSDEASRVKFLTEEDSIKVVNLNIDKSLTEKSNANYKTALTIPVEWKSYKVSENGAGLAEQEDTKIHWSQRPYIGINFAKVVSASSTGESDEGEQNKKKALAEGSRLVALDVQDDYFSFVIESKDTNTRIRYSFARVRPSNYVGKTLFKSDKRLFGFFDTRKDVVNNYKISRQEDLDKNTFISRFNPKSGKIVFHFTKTTPAWIRPHVRKAVDEYWNEAFQAAGTGLQIALDDTFDVELGDLRYNALNIIENHTASNLFGYGPSLKDPFTGEIISATTNVHLTPIREEIISEIRTYINMKLGGLETGRMSGISALLSSINDTTIKATQDGVSFITDAFPATRGLTKMYVPDDKNPNKFALKKIDFRQRTKGRLPEFDVAAGSGNIHKEIESQCSEILTYIKEIQGQKVTHNEKENDLLDSCSRKLVVTKFMGTLVHEMGHNFGLRHNFMASNDAANFWPTSVTGTEHQVRSSSVMEYSTFNEDRLVKPGPYDIAAIRFGYADAIELKDGSIVNLKTDKSIAANLAGRTAKAFKFCTDEDVALQIDPMCARHDAGVTPLEVVKNIITDYQASYQTINFRGDSLRSVSPAGLQNYHMRRFFMPLMRFYGEWRAGLTRYLGQDEQYLERMTSEEFEAVIAKMKSDDRYKTFVEQYRPAANAIFDFLIEVAAMPDRSCVLQGEDAMDIQLDSLEKVRTKLFYDKGISVKTCAEAAANGFWSTKYTLKKEVGQFANSFRYDLSPQNASEPLDVLGTNGDRFNAIMMLTQRLGLSYEEMTKGLQPSMLDEPSYRERVQKFLVDRTNIGMKGYLLAKDFGSEDSELLNILSQLSFPKFATEKDLLAGFTQLYLMGVAVPGNTEASNSRKEAISVYLTANPTQQLVQQAKDYVVLNNAYAFVMESTATGALSLMQRYKESAALRNLRFIDVRKPEVAKLIAVLQERLPTVEEAQAMTLSEAIERYNTVDFSVTGAVQSADTYSLVSDIAGFLQGTQNLKGMLDDPEMQETFKKEPEKKKQIEDLLKQNFGKFMEAKLPAPLLGRDTIAQRINEVNNKATFYNQNRSDIDAQVDLIRTSLMMFGASMFN